MQLNQFGYRFSTVRGYLAAAIVASVGMVATGIGSKVVAQEEISKNLLIKLSRDQTQILCTSEAFTQCMGFTEAACLDLGEKAVEQCLAPLPETIPLADLANDTIEACPRDVYAEAGFPDEEAVACLQEVLKP